MDMSVEMLYLLLGAIHAASTISVVAILLRISGRH